MNATRNGSNGARHPLVMAYLDSLERELAGSENRSEIVQSVREHIDEALATAPEPSDATTVQEVLNELGPVERISAVEERPAAAVAPRRQWGLLLAGVLAVISLGLVLILPFVSIPMAIATLAIGVVSLVHRTESRGAGWTVVIVSTLTLLVALAAWFFFLRPVPGPIGDPTGIPTEVGSTSG